MDFFHFALGSVVTGMAILILQNFMMPLSELGDDAQESADDLQHKLVDALVASQRQSFELARVLAVHSSGAVRTAAILQAQPEDNDRPQAATNNHLESDRFQHPYSQSDSYHAPKKPKEGVRPGEIRNEHVIPDLGPIETPEEREERLERESMQETAQAFMGMGASSEKHMSFLASQLRGIKTPDGGTMVDPRPL